MAALLVFCLVGRLLWVAVHPVNPPVGSDYQQYHRLASTLARYGVLGTDASSPQAFWPPGWPVVLAALYSVTGPSTQLGAMLGVLFEWGAIVIAALATSRLLRPPFALAAVAVMCFYPSAIAYAPVLATEHLAALLFTGLTALLAFTGPSIRTALAAGLLTGALLLERGDYGFAMVVVVAIWSTRGIPLRRWLAVSAVAIVGALVFIAPWAVRNASTFGEFIPTSTNGGITFYDATLAPRFTLDDVIKRFGITSTTAPKALENKYWHLGWMNVKKDPIGWLTLDLKRAYYQYGKESTMLFYGEITNPWIDRFAILYWLGIVAFGVVGFGVLAMRWRALPRPWLTIAASIGAVTFVKLFFVVNERDRLPLTYLLIVVATLGAQQLFAVVENHRARRRPSNAVAL